MRYPSTAFLLLSLCSAPLGGQTNRGPPPKPTPIPNVPRTVPQTASQTQARPLPPVKLEDEWTTALIKRDTRTFRSLRIKQRPLMPEDTSCYCRRGG